MRQVDAFDTTRPIERDTFVRTLDSILINHDRRVRARFVHKAEHALTASLLKLPSERLYFLTDADAAYPQLFDLEDEIDPWCGQHGFQEIVSQCPGEERRDRLGRNREFQATQIVLCTWMAICVE